MHSLRPVILLPVVPALATGVGARRGGASHRVDVSAKNHAKHESKFDGRGFFARVAHCKNLSLFHHKENYHDDRFLNLHEKENLETHKLAVAMHPSK